MQTRIRIIITFERKSCTEEPNPALEQDPRATVNVNKRDASAEVSGPRARASMHTAGPTRAIV